MLLAWYLYFKNLLYQVNDNFLVYWIYSINVMKNTIKKFTLICIISIMLLTTMFAMPAMAQEEEEEESNFICESDGLSGILSTVTEIIVILGALVAIVGGTAFMVADSVNPGEKEYAKKRNMSLILGLGSIVFIYAGNALASTLDDSLDFTCIVPFIDE